MQGGEEGLLLAAFACLGGTQIVPFRDGGNLENGR